MKTLHHRGTGGLASPWPKVRRSRLKTQDSKLSELNCKFQCHRFKEMTYTTTIKNKNKNIWQGSHFLLCLRQCLSSPSIAPASLNRHELFSYAASKNFCLNFSCSHINSWVTLLVKSLKFLKNWIANKEINKKKQRLKSKVVDVFFKFKFGSWMMRLDSNRYYSHRNFNTTRTNRYLTTWQTT